MEFLEGEHTLEHATRVEEDLNMDEVYEALDSFTSALKLACEYEAVEL